MEWNSVVCNKLLLRFVNKCSLNFETDFQTDYRWFLGSCKDGSPTLLLTAQVSALGLCCRRHPSRGILGVSRVAGQLGWTDDFVGCFWPTRFIKLDKWSPKRFRMASSSIEVSEAKWSSKMVAIVVYMQRWSVVVQRPNRLIEANVIRGVLVEIVNGMPPKVIDLHGMSWYIRYLPKTYVIWTFRSDFSAWLDRVYPEFRMLLGDQTCRGSRGMTCF